MSRQVFGTAVLVFLLCAAPAWAQSQYDTGARDTVRVELSQSQTGGICRITADIYFFNDQQELMGAFVCLKWNFPGLEYDTITPAPVAESAFELLMEAGKQLVDSLDHLLFGGISVVPRGLLPSPVARRVWSAKFHLDSWTPGDTLFFDTGTYLDDSTLFSDAIGEIYSPVWIGPVGIVLDSVMTAVEQPGDQEALPDGFSLSQNYPNPFNPETVIDYSIPVTSRLELTVVNQLGQTVAVLFDGVRSAGTYRAFWNGRNSSGEPVSSGVYLYRLRAGEFTQSKKMLLLK